MIMIYKLLKLILPFKVKEFLKYLFFIKNYNFSKKISLDINNFKFFIPRSDFKLENNIYYRIIEKENKKIDQIKEIHNFFKAETVIDIGANIGYWSLIRYLNLPEIKKFYCFEPSKVTYSFLNVNLSKINKIQIFNYALGNSNSYKKLSFPFWENNKSYRIHNLGLRSIYGNTDLVSEKIKVKKFDDTFSKKFFGSKSFYIKIDTEGYELEVLKGMENFIANTNKLTIELEFNDNVYKNISADIVNEIIIYLNKYNFKAYYFNKNKIIHINLKDIEKLTKKETNNLYFRKI